MTTRSIDINADLGESGGFDEALFPLISSANIACGYHAGDADTMRESVRLALAHGVAIGAHPSLKDLDGFGRGWIGYSPQVLHEHLVDQISTLLRICGDEGAVLAHVKTHGALYNMAAIDEPVALVVARAIEAVDPSLSIFAQPGSEMERVATGHGLPVVREAFADRAYNANGTLVSREIEGAVLHDPVVIGERMAGLVSSGELTTIDGQTIPLVADTLCIHSDTPGAVAIATELRRRLQDLGIEIQSRT